MEQITIFLFLRQHISEDLGRSRNTKAQQHLFFLRTPRGNKYPHLCWKPMVRTRGQSLTPSLNVSMQTEASESRESSSMVARVIDGGLLVQIPSQIIYWLDFRDPGERVDIRKLSPIWTLLTFRRHSWVNAKITDILINSRLKVNQCNNFCMATGGAAANTYSINFSTCNLTDSSSALSNYHH